MVKQVINATYTETYDLNTAVGELSLLAIHTPQAGALLRMFHGFFEQYKKYKINACNIRMVCASQQALTPDLVGLEAGSVDPRDVLNPILFKACTGESINLLVDQIYNSSQTLSQSLGSNSIDQHIDNRQIASNIYYQLLSDDTWRKEHPQNGLNVFGLRPMVHRIVTTQPFKWSGVRQTQGYGSTVSPDVPKITGSDTPVPANNVVGFGAPSGGNTDTTMSGVNPSVFVSNGLTEMPWLDTSVVRSGTIGTPEDETSIIPSQVTMVRLINNVPRVYMGCIILPPAILQRLFFRLQVSWSISFRDWRPSQDVGTLQHYDFNLDASNNSLASDSIGDSTYWNMYHSAAAKADLLTGAIGKEESSFTTNENAEVDKIMESGS